MGTILNSLSPFLPPLPRRFGPCWSLTLPVSPVPLLWAHLIESDLGLREFRFFSNPSTGGGSHGLNYLHPTPEHWVPSLSLCSLSLSVSLACSSANAPAQVLFQQFMLLSTHCRVPVLHRGLEMLSPLPPYTVTCKIFHKLDWDWQFRIQRWRLRWSGIG